jgi:hypothetical protein
MSPEEKERLWAERMENRFGPNWVDRFDRRTTRLPIFPKNRRLHTTFDWRLEGF